jgi:uncharacterized membrane protein
MKKILICFLICLSICYSALSIVRHAHFQSGGFDLGLYDQAVWQFAHNLAPYNTVKERIIFGDHLVLTLPFFGILFYLWDNVRILLIAQAWIISFSAIAIYEIAKKRLLSPLTALMIAIMYSLFYGIQYGVFFDFHPVIIGVALLAWLAYFWEFEKKKLFWITLVVSLLTQENMGIAVFSLSAIFFFRKEFRKQALLVGLLGIIYSLVAVKVSAFFSTVGYQYLPEFPRTLWEAAVRFFDSEEKRQVWLYSYGWFSFLPIFSPGSLIAVLVDLSQYFLTGPKFFQMWSPYTHHRAILSVFLTLGTIDILVFLKNKKISVVYASIVLLFIAGLNQYYFHFVFNKLVKPEYWKEESWMENTRKLIALVPKDASVATQQNLVPHLSHRKEIYLVWPREHENGWWLDFGGKPEYLVVDTRPNQWLTQILESNENWQSAISNMEREGRIVQETHVGDAKLYKIDWK